MYRASTVRHTRHQDGFTLLEAIVALIIAGAALAALYQGAAAGLGATATSSLREQAIVRARSHLAMAAHGGRLTAGTFQGDDGEGFHWLLRVAPVQVAAIRQRGVATRPASGQLTLYSVQSVITWREGAATRRVSLATEEIGGS